MLRKSMLGAAIMALALMAGTARAQAANPAAAADEKGDSRVIMDWDQFKTVTGWDAKADDEADKGKFVVPWKEVQDLFEIQIKDLDTAELKLPWQEFKALLEWSVAEKERKRKEKLDEAPAPVPYLIAALSGSACFLFAEIRYIHLSLQEQA